MICVSIIIPVYNSANYLRNTLDSICNQKFPTGNYEIICVDDGSKDGSVDILKEYATAYPNLQVLYQKDKTDGAGAARNMGMHMASGEYITFIDADDFADPDMLKLTYEKAREADVDILMFDAWKYDDVKKEDLIFGDALVTDYLPLDDIFDPHDYPDMIFKMTHGAVWGRLFKRDFVQAINLEFFDCHYWDDIEFFYPAICMASKVCVMRKRLLHYRWNATGNQSSQFMCHPEIGYTATYEIRRRFELYGIWELYKRGAINCLLMRAFWVLENITNPLAFDHLWSAMKKEYLEKIGAYEISDYEYDSKKVLISRNLMRDSDSSLDYLLKIKTVEHNEKECFIYNLLSKISKEESLCIYGAGKVGKRIFSYLIDAPDINLIGWTDRKYTEIGFPLLSVDKMINMKPDRIIVAIDSEITALKVKYELVSYGIKEKSIILSRDLL